MTDECSLGKLRWICTGKAFPALILVLCLCSVKVNAGKKSNHPS